MKKIIGISLLTLCFLFSKAGNDDKIKGVVNKWNELHNTHQTEEFLSLYAPDVLFYGINRDRNYCYRLKTKFLNTVFQQEIISPVTITYYSNGVAKADFTKRTKSKKTTREHLCYLLLKKIDGSYHITAESDLQTDQNKNVQLNLGKPLINKDKKNLIYIVVAVLLSAGLLILYFLNKRKRKYSEDFIPVQVFTSQSPSSLNATLSEKQLQQIKTEIKEEIINEVKEEFVSQKTVKEKGDEFEKYVVENFNEVYFKILEWRSDKYHKGQYPESSRLPDLEYLFQQGNQKMKFAIECKWRQTLPHTGVQIARHDQLQRYQTYQQNNRVPVFILLGVGGIASNPERLYIIPLAKVYNSILPEHYLTKFERRANGNFWLDVERKMLF